MAWLIRISNRLLILEQFAAMVLAGALLLLILLNIVTRAANAAIFWVDELAIYAMIWMALFGASAMIRLRLGVAVSLLTDQLAPRVRNAVARLVDLILFGLAATLLVLSWQWFDPLALVANGFDFDRFAQATFKFIYSEPTNTIGIQKFWIWLAVPLMSINMSIHALANLIEGPPAESAGDGDGASGRRGEFVA